jgi:hypothetical protein
MPCRRHRAMTGSMCPTPQGPPQRTPYYPNTIRRQVRDLLFQPEELRSARTVRRHRARDFYLRVHPPSDRPFTRSVSEWQTYALAYLREAKKRKKSKPTWVQPRRRCRRAKRQRKRCGPSGRRIGQTKRERQEELDQNPYYRMKQGMDPL